MMTTLTAMGTWCRGCCGCRMDLRPRHPQSCSCRHLLQMCVLSRHLVQCGSACESTYRHQWQQAPEPLFWAGAV